MTDIVKHQPQTALTERMEFARALSTASLLPRAYQQNPGNVLLAMELGDALGIRPIQAINAVHVIEGRPSASADLIASLVRKAGHKLRISGDDTAATAQIIRADDPEFTYEATWTLDRAKAAGLTGKGVWKSYPAAMLKARAITEVARMGASDSLYGVVYTPEELGADTTADGAPVAPGRPSKPQGSAALRAAVTPAEPDAAPEPEPVADEVTGEVLEGITPAQSKALHASFNEAGVKDRDQRLAYCRNLIGRDIASSSDLTKDEASRVLDALKADAETPAEPTDLWAAEEQEAGS